MVGARVAAGVVTSSGAVAAAMVVPVCGVGVGVVVRVVTVLCPTAVTVPVPVPAVGVAVGVRRVRRMGVGQLGAPPRVQPQALAVDGRQRLLQCLRPRRPTTGAAVQLWQRRGALAVLKAFGTRPAAAPAVRPRPTPTTAATTTATTTTAVVTVVVVTPPAVPLLGRPLLLALTPTTRQHRGVSG